MSKKNRDLYCRVMKSLEYKKKKLEKQYYNSKYEYVFKSIGEQINFLVDLTKNDGNDIPIRIKYIANIVKVDYTSEYDEIEKYIEEKDSELENIKSTLNKYKINLLQEYDRRGEDELNLIYIVEDYKNRFLNELNELLDNFEKDCFNENINYEGIFSSKNENEAIEVIKDCIIKKSNIVNNIEKLNVKMYEELNQFCTNVKGLNNFIVKENLKAIDIGTINLDDIEKNILKNSLCKSYDLKSIEEFVAKNSIYKKMKINKLKEFIKINYDEEIYELKIKLTKQIFTFMINFKDMGTKIINETYSLPFGNPETKNKQIEYINKCEDILDVDFNSISAKELILNKIIL